MFFSGFNDTEVEAQILVDEILDILQDSQTSAVQKLEKSFFSVEKVFSIRNLLSR